MFGMSVYTAHNDPITPNRTKLAILEDDKPLRTWSDTDDTGYSSTPKPRSRRMRGKKLTIIKYIFIYFGLNYSLVLAHNICIVVIACVLHSFVRGQG